MRTTTLPISRWLVAFAAAALASGGLACQRADSILLVEVGGDLKLMPVGFAVTISPRQLAARDIRVAPRSGGAISLPASFTIQLPCNATGPISVGIQGLDANDAVIAQGAATQQNLNVGGQTILPVTIVATGSIAVTTPSDAGAAPVDAQPAADAHPGVDAGLDATVRDATLVDAPPAADGAAGAGGPS
jgi:hypothetical protein